MSSENDEVEKKEQMEEHSDLEEEKEEKEEEEKKKEEEEKEEEKNEETENDETMEEDEKVEDADSSVENDKNSQNELTPTKKTKKSEKNTRKNKRKSSEVEKIKEGENEEKSVKSSKKKKKLVKDKSKEKKDSDEVKKIEIVETDTITKRADWTGYFAKRDHSVNQIYQSEIPQICKDEPCQLGVDEAGRGPVLGPMVYGISYAPLSQKQLLVDMGCADSKSLTEEKRDIIFDKICDNGEKMGYAIDSISPNYIANCMYRRTKTSLNEVSMDSAINLIQMTIDAGVFVKEIYVDTVGKPEKYQLKLELKFPGIKIVVAKKADSTYPIVSAASICAKVSRDHALRAWQFREGENETAYGSGYPNDPATKSWLGDNVDSVFGFPQIVRFSWSTAENILESKAIPVEWEDPEEENVPEDTGPKISSYFLPSPASSKKKEREKHKFFISRCLKNAIEL